MPSGILWTSKLIEQTLENLRINGQADLSAFHRGDIELKDADIYFQLTPEEIDEFHLCSQDIVYFVEKYCRFLTDSGRKLVKLRDYQKRILRAIAQESWSDKYKEFIPDVRNLIMMQARQSGKCFFNGDIIIQYPSGELFKIPISLFYYMLKGKLTILEKIKIKLIMLYIKLN